MGFYEALSWVKIMNLVKLIIKGDAKIVVYAINSSSKGSSTFHDYIVSCKDILVSIPFYSIHFVKRSANDLAHKFAKVARFYENPTYWDDPPELVGGLLNSFCLCEPLI